MSEKDKGLHVFFLEQNLDVTVYLKAQWGLFGPREETGWRMGWVKGRVVWGGEELETGSRSGRYEQRAVIHMKMP